MRATGLRALQMSRPLATAKANGLEPHAWLTDVLSRLPTTKDRDIAMRSPLVDRTRAVQGAMG